ncbi:MAG: polysaccharide deacetylase family protein [Fimbriimonadaceae bacterium]|nr:polysaccharide deacetylase family protein [Fimbriimonadaceae bacterium]
MRGIVGFLLAIMLMSPAPKPALSTEIDSAVSSVDPSVRTPESVDWQLPARYVGQTVSRHPRGFDKRSIALTFDDGPDPRFTPGILDELKKRNMKATFFVLGWRVERYPALVKRIFDEGHTVANHTRMHPARPDQARATEEVKSTSEAIKKACGKYPTLFRPPYGIRDSWTARIAKGEGMASVIWTISSADTQTKDTKTIFDNVTKTPSNGDIILMHDIHEHTASAIPRILDELDHQGWNCVTLDKLFRQFDEFENSRN